MKLRVRHTCLIKDFSFYFWVLTDSETRRMMFDKKKHVWNYLFSPKCECKYICHILRDGKWKPISFVRFTKGKRDNEYWLAGAIPKKLQNSGKGIYAAVAFITVFFSQHPGAIIKSGSFLFNQRAYKTTLSIGFSLDKKDTSHFESSLTETQFSNDFVHHIKSKIDLLTQL